jgi:hypothetical protein
MKMAYAIYFVEFRNTLVIFILFYLLQYELLEFLYRLKLVKITNIISSDQMLHGRTLTFF